MPLHRRTFVKAAGACALAGPRVSMARPLPAARYDWRSVPFGAGGFVDGFLFHPRERGLLYLRTDIGGAYRFDEASQSWVPLLDHLSKADADLMGVLSLAVDANDANRLYAACGLYLAKDARAGALLASNDRGASWQVHELGVQLGGNAPGRASGERLQVDPSDGKVLWLGTSRDGLLRSTDRGRTFQPTGFAPRHVSCVLVDAKQQAIYAGSHDQPGLYVSLDGGASFVREEATPRQAAQQMALGPDGALFVTFALGERPVAVNPGLARSGSVWTRDARGAWREITPEKPGQSPRGFGYSGVDVHPDGRIVVSTIERPGDEIFVSDDGGAHWTALGPRSRHDARAYPWLEDYMRTERNLGHWTSAVKLDPFNADRALYGTGYGVWMTRQLGAALQGGSTPWAFTVANLEETATLEIRSPSSGARLLAAMGDVAGGAWTDPTRALGTRFFTPTKETNRALDVAELAPDIIARTGDHTGGHWSDDGGVTWHRFETSPRTTRSNAEGLAVSARGSAFVYAPQGGPALWSHDRGTTWTPCRGWPASDRFLAPVADRAADGVFYVHDAANGQVLVSTDGGRSFGPMLADLPRLDREERSHLVSAPGAERDLWLALPDRLLHVAGRGRAPRPVDAVAAAWMLALGRGSPGAPYRHSLYLWGRLHNGGSAEEGLFRSDDGGGRFVRINDDAHRYGRLLSMAGDAREHGVLYIAPHGRGVVAGRPLQRETA
jgi:hypothetical protein